MTFLLTPRLCPKAESQHDGAADKIEVLFKFVSIEWTGDTTIEFGVGLK